MEVQFAHDDLRQLESGSGCATGRDDAVVRAFRKTMRFIRSAVDERDFRSFRSLRFEKLKGKRKHQYSMRLNDQFRLVVELGQGTSGKQVTIVSIEDYH